MTVSLDEIKELNNELKNLKTEEVYKFLNTISLNGISKERESQNTHIPNLNKAFKEEDLVLVLGAGVSVPYNLPSWENLLQKLLFETFNASNNNEDTSSILSKLFPKLFPSSPIISARFLENYFKKHKNGKTFEEMIKDALYENIKRNEDSPILKEILQYCIAPGKSPNLDSIITYNYDDILEVVLTNSNVDIPFKSVYTLGMNPSNGELPIYHVHGYLPEKQKIEQNYSVTLSENLYHKQYNDIYSWNNMVQINKFREKTCLLIGLSLTDPNIRRLLDIAMLQKGNQPKYHYLFKKRYDVNTLGRGLELILNNNEPLLDEKARANMRLDETAKHLLEKMEEFEEIDADSFGIKIIWINDFDEIADYLNKIRTL
ncbi:SIR2 family protein (plasmid) [Bacillus thuringiensis serovar sumiyoshiensis]|uniref:SIR2 family protein n=1 Tax=Bacillus thuringiensis TaxID=1428 RepID=UPI000A3A3347|nr:SIR2 family protein [Bacillus thuringiensis]OTW83838.1 hypothetical protein BK710_17630 [Bacillus thuringiensis serovar sumiyoshiensis]